MTSDAFAPPTSRTDLLASLLQRTGLLALERTLRLPRTKQILILGYHRVLPAVTPTAYPFDLELISATPEEFAWQMAFLRRHFAVWSVGQIAERLHAPASLPERVVAVTFDDGFDDNYHYAFPILRRLGLPATMFVTTDFLSQDAAIWFEFLALAVMRAPIGTLPAFADLPALPTAADEAGRRADLKRLLDAMKVIPEGTRTAYLAAVARAIGPELGASARSPLSRAMTWDQAREMHAAGIEIASHSVTHPILSQVDDRQLEAELAGSRQRLEDELAAPVSTLSYPVGGAMAFDDRVIAAARRAGYACAVSYIAGTNPYSRLEPFALRRVHVERYTSRARFEAMMMSPTRFA